MKTPILTVWSYDDWAGLWEDDELVEEGHSIPFWVLANQASGQPVILNELHDPDGLLHQWLQERAGRLYDMRLTQAKEIVAG